MKDELNGILLVDKPQGWTSFDVVAKVRGLLSREIRKQHEERGFCREDDGAKVASSAQKRTNSHSDGAAQSTDKASTSQKSGASDSVNGQAFRCKCRVKVGHAGTLDPLATGLLILAVGKATKSIELLMKKGKVYEAEITLGATSTTDDAEGEITETGKSQEIEDMLHFDDVLISFIGEIEQVPPAFSAIKVDGKRAYKLAREGKEVRMKPRKVKIHSIVGVEYDHPKILFDVEVSSGTYIRSLARDIGVKFGQGAYLSALRRLSIGEYSVQDAIEVSDLSIQSIQSHLKTIA